MIVCVLGTVVLYIYYFFFVVEGYIQYTPLKINSLTVFCHSFSVMLCFKRADSFATKACGLYME